MKCNRGEKFLGLSRLLSEICTRIFSYSILTYKITSKRVKFEWDDKCQSSFERLKEILVEAPVLTQLTSGRDYTMYSDALRIGLGCVLMQNGKVVAYASR